MADTTQTAPIEDPKNAATVEALMEDLDSYSFDELKRAYAASFTQADLDSFAASLDG